MSSGARWVPGRALGAIVAGLVMTLGNAVAAAADAGSDAFIAGYATAILEREFSLTGDAVVVNVHEGTITLSADAIKDGDREKVVAALSRISGVRQVVMAEGKPQPPASPAAPPITGGGWALFPDERLFSPLLADPRWPHFSAKYLHFFRSGTLKLVNAAAITLGEEFNLIGYGSPAVGKFSIGIQPAVFGLFNLDASSKDLVNADYRIAIPLNYRYNIFSAQARVFHQSSHLGDEFILDTPIHRVNLSYETVDLRVSAELGAFRIYGGGGRIIHSEPDLRPGSAQQGVEYVSPKAYLNDSIRPVVALDVQEREETGWEPDVSLRVGVDFSSPEKGKKRVQLLLEYYRGHNPSGQFYEDRIETAGLGLYVNF